MKHRVLAAAVSLVMCAAGIAAMTADVSAEAAKTSLSAAYKKKYKDILDKTDYFQGVYIGDLVGDSREELLVATNGFGLFTLYVPTGKKIVKYDFDVMSVWGFTKYIKADRTIICMNNYGHTEGSPYPISIETLSVKDEKAQRYNIKSEQDGTGVSTTIDGKTVTNADFVMSLHYMIADIARSEYIPLVKHDENSLPEYEGEIIDIDYDDYIKQMLG